MLVNLKYLEIKTYNKNIIKHKKNIYKYRQLEEKNGDVDKKSQILVV